jgi:MFS superfamily sulfate permease-like transporter
MDDWAALESEWRQAGGSASSHSAVDAALVRARRARVLVPLTEGAVALAALGVTALALYHAAVAFEVVLGLLVGAAIALVWTRRIIIRTGEHGSDSSGSVEYLAFIRGVRLQQVRLAGFIWMVLALELAFLAPWWERGGRIHPRTLTSVSSWLGMYLPIVMMLALLFWSIRLRRAAQMAVRSIDRLSEEFRDDA